MSPPTSSRLTERDWLKNWYTARGFPDNYFVFDFETSGLSPSTDLILQAGYCHVVNRKMVANEAFILDWTSYSDLDQLWLRHRLHDTKQFIEMDRKTKKPTGKKYPFSVQRMQAEGLPPLEVLRLFYEMMSDARDRDEMFVGHNACHYDSPLFTHHVQEFLDVDFEFGDNEILDTGMIEKAIQINMPPGEAEGLSEWAARVYNHLHRNAQGKIAPYKWSLDQHVIPKYDLEVKHGLDISKAHHADFDCLVTHHLLEEYREIAECADALVS